MSFHDQNYNEKRDFIRMRVETSALLTLPDQAESIQVLCQDLSSQGVQLVLQQPLAEGTPIELLIPSPTPGLDGLKATGEVMRCVAADEGGFAVGIQFKQVE